MKTLTLMCKVCGADFVLTCGRAPAYPTCSKDCRGEMYRRHARRRALVAWSEGVDVQDSPAATRIREALAETRAAVEKLLIEGREARRST